MDIDINDLRAIVTVLSLGAFLSIVWWAYGAKSSQQGFEEAAQLPFSDAATDQVELGLAGNEQRKSS